MYQFINKLKQKESVENGYTIFIHLSLVSVAVFLSSLFYLSQDLFEEDSLEMIFLFVTIFLNPFYIQLFLFPLVYLFYKLFPNVVFKVLFSILIGSFGTYLYIEKMVFSMFKFHVNSFVLKILGEKGALQVLGIGTAEISAMVLAVIIGAFISGGVYTLLGKTNLPIWLGKKLRGKIRKIGFIVLILFVYLLDKGTFAWYLHNKKTAVYLMTQKVPLYIPSQGGGTFESLGFMPPETDVPMTSFSKHLVKYPLKPYKTTIKDGQSLPNMILLMSDALRPDMIDPDIMPNVYRFKTEKAEDYRNHFSGSNGTTLGLFTLFFGLPSRYMNYFSRIEISPVFFDALLANNYSLKLYSSKSLGWFGTEQVVFYKVKKFIRDELDNDSVKSDLMVTELALKTIEEHRQEEKKPLFLMVFLDSPHLPHFQDKKYKKFLPDETSVMFDPSKKEDRIRGLNQYKNASNYVDHLFGRILDKLETEGYYNDSVIYVTSDHGSEKYEHGHWGHASAFTNEQLQVPSLLYYPGSKPKNIDRLTSHADVTVTFLELMGEKYDRHLHSLGQSLFDETPRDYIIADGWANQVLIDGKVKIDWTPYEGFSYYKVTDAHDNPVPNSDEIISQYTPKILLMFDDFQKFLQ
ncbi:sulfatase-like hydrolase/transferase [bacterium]|nr:sulfatase-like hydrolase/transferase [bacterium]